MVQAKKRGSFEERRAAVIKAAESKTLKGRVKRVYSRCASVFMAVALMFEASKRLGPSQGENVEGRGNE